MAKASPKDTQKELSSSYEQVLSLTQSVSTNQRERRERYESIKKNIRATSLILVFIVAVVAGISDLLSIVALGWITSWLFSLLMWLFIKNRISAIEKATESMTEFAKGLSKEAARVAPGSSLGDVPDITQSSYTHIFVRDTIITQAIELIPIVDILPFYLGQLAKAYVDQRKRREQAREIVNYCGQLIDILDSAENVKMEQAVAPIYEHITEINRGTELAFG